MTAFPVAHWQKLWSNNPQEPEPGDKAPDWIFPNRLSLLAQQHDE